MDTSMKRGRKPDLILENRIRLNAGRISVFDLAWLIGIKYRAIESKARRMKISLRVRKVEA